jgi:hypothetical protein
VLDDILRDVVCDCGNYRHHGVRWMPEGSGEGLSVAVAKLQRLLKETRPKAERIVDLLLADMNSGLSAWRDLDDDTKAMVRREWMIVDREAEEDYWKGPTDGNSSIRGWQEGVRGGPATAGQPTPEGN